MKKIKDALIYTGLLSALFLCVIAALIEALFLETLTLLKKVCR
ncbi:hypothetical protein [Arcanobacterium haemolyticum]